MKLRFKFLIYMSAFLLAYDALNIPMISILDRKPISLFLCGIFLIFNIEKIFYIKYKRRELIFIGLIILSYIIGYIKIINVYNNDFSGYKRGINSIIGFIVIYMSFRMYFYYNTKNRFKKIISIIFWGYSILTISSGILQFVYYYIYPFSFIKKLFEFLLFNKMNYISFGRIHFMLGEPSFVGGYYYLLFIPTLVYLYKVKVIGRSKAIVIFIIITILNLCSFSNRFIFDTIIFIVILTIVLMKKRNIVYKYSIILVFSLLIICFYLIFIKNVFEIKNDNLTRIEKIFVDNSFAQDKSFIVRKTLINSGIKGVIDKPLIGWGAGAYKYAFIDNYELTNNIEANAELLDYVIMDIGMVSYSYYITILCENGFIGIMMILCIVNTCINRCNKKNKMLMIIGWYILYIFVQNELNSYLPIMIWLALFNSEIIKIQEGKKNNEINDNNTLF